MLSSSDNGKTVELQVGSTIELRLPGNPSTGYEWAVDADPAFVEMGDGRYMPSSNGVGSGGQLQWSIKAKAAGTTTIRLKHWRPWEGEPSVVERYEVTLAISPVTLTRGSPP